ncbi:MAG: VWA domain-containing protein [Acidobacteria bacterium]|nr:MAG: VWA domain-containing protein [Acidobacteriota bacterium]REK04333.1 MAG: VWA domain-containing protein [Acidobacteriota bacterium]
MTTVPGAKIFASAFLSLVLLAPGAPTEVAAQQPNVDPAAAGSLSEVVDVRVVNVEAVVTDRRGRPVSGLPRSAFELWVDGVQVPLRYFTEVRAGQAVEAEAADVADAPAVVAAAGEPVRRNVLVFIDELLSSAPERDRVLQRLIDQLPELGPADHMALVRFDGQLEVLTGWTRDVELLEGLLRGAKGRKTFGLRRFDAESTLVQQQLLGPDPRQAEMRLTLEERALVERLIVEVERAVRASSASLRSLGTPPGRRLMLLLSGGWPFSPAEYMIGETSRVFGDSDLLRGDLLLGPLRDTANLLGYTIYPVDVPGLQSTISADRFGSFGNRDGFRAGRDPLSYSRETTLHQSLFYLAEQTGGEALINSRRDGVLRAVMEDTSSYYWLGFVPERAGDDQRHEIEVRLADPDLKVRNRRDFYDFSRRQEFTLLVESALQFKTPPTATPLSVRPGRAERDGLTTMVLPLAVGIPADIVTLLPGPDGLAAQLELRVAVLDERGGTVDTPVVPISFSLSERPAEGTMLNYDTALKLRRKRQQLVVAVLDVPSGVMASSSLEIDP